MITVRYEIWSKRDNRPRAMEKEFKNEAAMQKWLAKAEKKDNWGQVLAYSEHQ